MSDCVTVFLFILLSTSVICEDCITFDFENGLDGMFDTGGICAGMEMWIKGTYTSLPIAPPHVNSKNFITPNTGLSCMTSFPFEMTPTGTLEVNVYMDSTNPMDQITILAQEIIVDGNDAVVGNIMLTSSSDDFVNGWHTLRVTTVHTRNKEGYITLLGTAAENSVVLIDSFRYFTLPTNEQFCQIYENIDIEATTEPISTIETTVESTTEPVSTAETEIISTTETIYTTDIVVDTTTINIPTTENESEDNTDDPDEEQPIGIEICQPYRITIIVLSTIIFLYVFYKIVRLKRKRVD